MKKIVLAVTISLMSVCAFANQTSSSSEEIQYSSQYNEEFSSAAELPEGSAIEALFETSSGRPVCPKGYLVAKKYCWSFKRFSFRHCGYFCSKILPPPRGKN